MGVAGATSGVSLDRSGSVRQVVRWDGDRDVVG